MNCLECKYHKENKKNWCPFYHISLENNYCGYNEHCFKPDDEFEEILKNLPRDEQGRIIGEDMYDTGELAGPCGEDGIQLLKEKAKHWEKNSAGGWDVNFTLPKTIDEINEEIRKEVPKGLLSYRQFDKVSSLPRHQAIIEINRLTDIGLKLSAFYYDEYIMK